MITVLFSSLKNFSNQKCCLEDYILFTVLSSICAVKLCSTDGGNNLPDGMWKFNR